MKKTGVALLCLFTLSIFQFIGRNSETSVPAFHRVDFISSGYRYEFPLYRDNADGIYSGGFTWLLTWGIRRPVSDAVVWDLFTGIECNISDRVMSGGLILGVRLGLVL